MHKRNIYIENWSHKPLEINYVVYDNDRSFDIYYELVNPVISPRSKIHALSLYMVPRDISKKRTVTGNIILFTNNAMVPMV